MASSQQRLNSLGYHNVTDLRTYFLNQFTLVLKTYKSKILIIVKDATREEEEEEEAQEISTSWGSVKRDKNVAMILYSWIIDCLKVYNISDEVI